ncbi:MAG: methyltransferase domain-containing protein [Actinomycetota bacterium]|nr:methyltransferase domain-containing protein [Actinomycetota bacterium]
MADGVVTEGAEEFAERLVGVLNGGMLALMTSIGHRARLFDVMASLPPATSAQIAEAAGLDERYVREWLGAMTTGGIVDHDPGAMTFFLPPERAASLTRAAGPENLAVQAQYVGLLAQVEDQILDCFHHGGGVPYAEFPRFQALMAEDSGAVHDATLIEVTLPLVPGLVERLQAGIDVADVGCGSGHAVNLMAGAFPASRFVGFDLSDTGIAAATAEAERQGLPNARFEKRDAATLDGSEQFDLLTTFDAVHDQARPDLVLHGIASSLRPGGVYLCVDVTASSTLADNVAHPLAPFLYTISCMHCMTVSLAAGGMGLGTMWGEQKARQMLADAGFTSVELKHVEGDILNNYYIATKA